MFDKILIANRGEIAVRVHPRLQGDGRQDRGGLLHGRRARRCTSPLADEAYCIGGPRPAESYLNEDAIITVALQSGCQGDPPRLRVLLGERRTLRASVRECGLAFIGPDPDVIDRMGDKDAARRTAARGRRAHRPWLRRAQGRGRGRCARRRRIGCPVLIKARAGGGGRGIRRGRARRGRRPRLHRGARRGERGRFGDGECYMEKFVSPAHHVEVQVLADAQGHVVSPRRARVLRAAPQPEARGGEPRRRCLDAHPERARAHAQGRP